MADRRRVRLEVEGIVQGVGFRPFLHRLAARLHLGGWCRNTTAGVTQELEGDAEDLAAFRAALRREAPPLAVMPTTASLGPTWSSSIRRTPSSSLSSQPSTGWRRAVSPPAM